MKIFDLLAILVRPASKFFRALQGLVAIAIGAVADPTGAINALIVRLIDFIAQYWPSTPEQLKIGSLLVPAIQSTNIGTYFVIELFSTASLMLAIVGTIKLYKLIPLKFT